MPPDITIKRNDVGKVISGQLLDADGNGADCSGFTSAKLFMRSITNPNGTPKINGATFTFSNAATGLWNYTMTAIDVNTSGWFHLEWKVGFAGGVKQTFPTDPSRPYKEVLIQDDIG